MAVPADTLWPPGVPGRRGGGCRIPCRGPSRGCWPASCPPRTWRGLWQLVSPGALPRAAWDMVLASPGRVSEGPRGRECPGLEAEPVWDATSANLSILDSLEAGHWVQAPRRRKRGRRRGWSRVGLQAAHPCVYTHTLTTQPHTLTTTCTCTLTLTHSPPPQVSPGTEVKKTRPRVPCGAEPSSPRNGRSSRV